MKGRRAPIGVFDERQRTQEVGDRRTLVARARAAAVAAVLTITGLQSGALFAQDAVYVGDGKCIVCHVDDSAHFSHTRHAKIFRLNPKTERERQGCEACHGPGSRHVANALDKTAIIGFTREWGTPIEVQNAQCLGCHEGAQRVYWAGSTHALNRIGCSDCHSPMARLSRNGLMRTALVSDTCALCHQQQRAEFQRRSHMPLPEGKMSCADCHNPHGSVTRPLLKADSVNETCTTCHAEKRGPFLWEHAPVRESCLNCHMPHGSNHDYLLVGARPFICQQCHSPPLGHPGAFYNASQTAAAAQQPGGNQSARVIGRSCQNCHSQIHGSNHPSGARFQR
jgi:DmsE family decaheme c-type cytochrome